MENIDQLKQDVREGRIDTDRLVDLLITQQHLLQTAYQRIAQLEQQSGSSPTTKIDEPFSLRAEEQRQQARGKKKRPRPRQGRRGRLSTTEKVQLAERTEPVYPEGVEPNQCWLSHVRPVWQLEQGRAVLIAYQIYRGPNNQYGKIPGVLGRSEFGLTIILEIAYLVYVLGLSFDKVCLLLNFFQNLRLHKSQVDALLQRLARHWEHEFEILCTLLAHSLIVHADETSWSLNSVWALLSEKARVLLFGVHKDAATLSQFLDPATFAGVLFSDDAAVYANFTKAQKCWAHLLRKAIKLTLQDPDNADYRAFTDGLLEIYRTACRVQQDGRLGEAGRARKVEALEVALWDLCTPWWQPELPPLPGLDNDFRLLVNELMRLLLAQELFTFVTVQPVAQPNGDSPRVDATNNEAERSLREAALARKTGRTNKSPHGARRQTILASVLASLRLYLSEFTLSSVLAEIGRWQEVGRSCFAELLEKLNLRPEHESVLDQILPHPSG